MVWTYHGLELIAKCTDPCKMTQKTFALLWSFFVGGEGGLKYYLRNWSHVVPVCMKALAITVAEWQTEFLTASLPEKLITSCSRVHEGVGYYCGRMANWISDCILKYWNIHRFFEHKNSKSNQIFLVNACIVFPPKRLDIATSNFAGA